MNRKIFLTAASIIENLLFRIFIYTFFFYAKLELIKQFATTHRHKICRDDKVTCEIDPNNIRHAEMM